MKYIDILANFEREIGLLDNSVDKPSTDDSLFGLIKPLLSFINSDLMGILYMIHHMNRLRREEKI